MNNTNNNDKLIEINNLSFKIKNEDILKNINLNIYKNKNIAIIGKNGGGKSTFIKTILGFYKYNSGNIKYLIDKKSIGYLPQIRDFDTSFPINVFELVISGLTNKKNLFRSFNNEEKNKVANVLKEFDIFNIKDRSLKNLSGGQLQRALIARTIISKPLLIFLDEPESFLDKEFEYALFEKIKNFTNSTLVIITHNLSGIYDIVDSVCIIEKNSMLFEKKEDYIKYIQKKEIK